jgi:Fe-S-cluster containining protein
LYLFFVFFATICSMKKEFVHINDINIAGFGGCNGCSKCCDGSQFLFAPLFLSDIKDTYRHFPLAYIKLGPLMRLVFLLASRQGCIYLDQNGNCGIYEQRPHACRIYPFSPYQRSIYLDTSCPAVGTQGYPIAADGKMARQFWHPRLVNSDRRFWQTQRFIDGKKGFFKLGRFEGYTLYHAVGSSRYDAMIRASARHLRRYPIF